MKEAHTYAIQAHEGQTYGDEPYTVHLEAVVAIVRGVADTFRSRAVAWLHDVLEDTEADAATLAASFGRTITEAVQLVTDPEGPNRRARKVELHRRLANLDHWHEAHRLALIVKTADRLANVRASAAAHPGKLSMYRREHAAFRDAAYRDGLCDALWDEIDRLLRE